MSAVKCISLNGKWTLTYGPQRANCPRRPEELAGAGWPSIPAVVPGNVELDLMAAGRLEDPSVGTRIYTLAEMESYDWWYQRTFAATAIRPGQRAEIVLEGCDCIAAVWLNGKLVGNADNMLIAHRFDVTELLNQAGENQLAVRIESAVLAARRYMVEPGQFTAAVNYESLRIRKAPHMYGWDILPRLVSAGLWRDVKLTLTEPTVWRQIYFATVAVDAAKSSARVLVDWDFATDRLQLDGVRVRLILQLGKERMHQSEYPAFSTHGRAMIDLSGVQLWWPRGFGQAVLYDFTAELLDAGGTVLDLYAIKVGLRTIELVRTDLTTPDGKGEFVFRVNGERVFVKGTNWVPLDSLHSRDEQHLPGVFDMLVDLNCNMVRCWGGNVYEGHPFYDLCDRDGVMVWQDFAMGCAVYPQDEEFGRRIEAEAIAVVQKLRNHASLALWAGNNEGDEAFEWAQTRVDPNNDHLTRTVLPGVLRRVDPLRPFLPSSPYRAPAFCAQKRPPSEVLPEQHLWGPRDDFKGATYHRTAAHFASEIGYHGCPEVKSLEQMMEPDFVWPWQDNPQWLAHAVRPRADMHQFDYRIALMAKQIGVLFGQVPEKLDDFVLASQISQAEAFKCFVEWFRQGKWRRTGILWWNLRDGWPVISDAVVDYYNRKKLAYHYIKKVQSDACLIVGEPVADRHTIFGVNDTRGTVAGRFSVRDADGGYIISDQPFEIGANVNVPLAEMPASSMCAMWIIEWALANGIKGHNHYLAGPRPFDLEQYRGWLAKLM